MLYQFLIPLEASHRVNNHKKERDGLTQIIKTHKEEFYYAKDDYHNGIQVLLKKSSTPIKLEKNLKYSRRKKKQLYTK